MNKEDAKKILVEACALMRLSIADHQTLQAAIKVLSLESDKDKAEAHKD